jgi:predicted metal-dependent enzyme (double-stranded beta helix superfamily)
MSDNRINVVSVMRSLHDRANESPDFSREDANESHEARTIVAELIAAAEWVQSDAASDSPAMWTRFNAALARVRSS